ncbi:hypothetical protein [Acidovorax sp. A1169]|uniref:hypothetical protein n=1 Tax=Acidovorax sp. A1169 TaxID=3059524 RepID=UPI002737E681|nr:hypothetical protein [Acidovorax sp. A1169]MDP4078284.1 hypothetical protein [Acidovorax sp. A1169]
MTDQETIQEIKALVASFNHIFNERPGMLGDAVEVNAKFHVIDQLHSLLHKGRRIDVDESWIAFLISKKHIRGAENHFRSALNADPCDFSLLQKTRREYEEWVSRIDGPVQP